MEELNLVAKRARTLKVGDVFVEQKHNVIVTVTDVLSDVIWVEANGHRFPLHPFSTVWIEEGALS